MIADTIKATLAKRFRKEMRAIYYELGLMRRGRYRADVFALSMSGHVIIAEVKSSVQDFKRDQKMAEYLQFCNKFYLAAPESVLKKIEFNLPGAGTFVMSDDGTRILKVLPAKNRDIDPDVIFNLAIRAAFRNSAHSTRKNKKA